VILIKQLATLIVCLATVAAIAAAAPVPEDLAALAAKAQIKEPLASWCRGEFESRPSRIYAVAVTFSNGGGRYLILGMNGITIELASFSGGADLACYSPDEAKALNKSLAGSTTVHGRISPVWTTTVVCGFVEDTSAVCWQYSPGARAFVKVGEWVT